MDFNGGWFQSTLISEILVDACTHRWWHVV